EGRQGHGESQRREGGGRRAAGELLGEGQAAAGDRADRVAAPRRQVVVPQHLPQGTEVTSLFEARSKRRGQRTRKRKQREHARGRRNSREDSCSVVRKLAVARSLPAPLASRATRPRRRPMNAKTVVAAVVGVAVGVLVGASWSDTSPSTSADEAAIRALLEEQ